MITQDPAGITTPGVEDRHQTRQNAAPSKPGHGSMTASSDFTSEEEILRQLDRIVDIMRRLRDPETGCPWDVEQDFTTIAPYTIEEAYEVADAIHRNDTDDIRDELGDLLLQVVFQARIAEEAGLFNLADVAKSISDKMIDRHPHVFGDEDRPQIEQQSRRWEDIKASERAARGKTGVLDDVALGLSPMLRSLKLQKRAARVGFDWPHIDQVVEKLHEETAELRDELTASTADMNRIKDEVGDILFVAVNLARKAGVDPETALMACNSKFEKRFRYIEQITERNGKTLNESSLEEMESHWQDAKQKG